MKCRHHGLQGRITALNHARNPQGHTVHSGSCAWFALCFAPFDGCLRHLTENSHD